MYGLDVYEHIPYGPTSFSLTKTTRKTHSRASVCERERERKRETVCDDSVVSLSYI